MRLEEESKLQALSRNALKARASITQELGITAAATVDNVRFILEEILSHRLDTMRKNLIEQNLNDKYYKKELQQNVQFIQKQMEIIRDDNDKLKQQIIDHSIKNSQETNSNSKLNTITLQNMKTLALLKQIHQHQIDNTDYKNDINDNNDNNINNNNNNNHFDSNLLKKLKLENTELKAQLKQSQNHIKYLEESKINTIMTMSQEIQKLRQQIIDLSKTQRTTDR